MSRTNAESVIAKLAPVLLFALTAMLVPPAQAQTYTVIHNFTGGLGGNYPYDGLAPRMAAAALIKAPPSS